MLDYVVNLRCVSDFLVDHIYPAGWRRRIHKMIMRKAEICRVTHGNIMFLNPT